MIPLDLYAEIEAPDGTRYKWDANQPAGSRLRNFRFSTKIGEGFSDGGGQLARRIDLDYPDINLVWTVRVFGADGSIAYEGQIVAMPRELTDSHSIGVTLAGFMAHAKRRRFSEIYVDRDISAWGSMTARRRSSWLTTNWSPQEPVAANDSTDTSAANLSTVNSGAWVSPYKPVSEAWYDAGPGNLLAKIGYGWKIDGPLNSADVNWTWAVNLSGDDNATTTASSGNLRAAGPATGQTLSSASGWRYAFLQLLYNATPAGLDGITSAIAWSKLAAYGNHGLTLHTGEPGEPDGVYGSDVMRDIVARWCPLLDPSGIDDSDYVIQHLAWKEPVYPFDAFLEINKYHQRHLAVWDNRTLVWTPYDLSDYDWEIRTDDQGTTFSPNGPTTDDLWNGSDLTYVDLLTGKRERVTPDDDSTLADSSDENPFNQAGEDNWLPFDISTPQIRADAIQLGVAVLAAKNRPREAGTITVKGYIRDRAGNQQPVYKVRAGDTIAVTNFPNSSPRLIVETGYDDESKTLTAAVDFPLQTLEALFDRVANALTAKGLG